MSRLGEFTQVVRRLFVDGQLNSPGSEGLLRFQMGHMRRICGQNNLLVSADLIKNSCDEPRTLGEFNTIAAAIASELSRELFCYIPTYLAKYYEAPGIVTERASGAFPKATAELREAGTAFAAGLNTASVFHAMRAVEIGMRSLASDLKVSFPDKPLELVL